MLEPNKYTVEDNKNCLGKNRKKCGVNYSLGSNTHDISLTKRKKIALNSFDDKRCYVVIYKNVTWDYNPPGCGCKEHFKIKHSLSFFKTQK